jgi:putative Mg2+ transporter-C (MgtC) family protein
MGIYYQMFPKLGMEFEIFLRLAFTMGAAALVGIEREYQGRPAGLRTHILVAVGAAMISLISMELSMMVCDRNIDPAFRIDPGRIAAGVVTGIGFLGAGTIIKIGKTARGLTTAASIWCIASIGMGFGFGLYKLSILGSLFMLFTLVILGKTEKNISRNWYKNIFVEFTGTRDRIGELRNKFKEQGWRILDLKLKEVRAEHRMEVQYDIRMNSKYEVEQLVKILQECPFIDVYRIE